MKIIILTVVVVLVYAITNGLLFSCKYQSAKSTGDNNKPNFPFTVQHHHSGDVAIYLAPEQYNNRNLEDLCLWFHRNHLTNTRNLRIYFFADKARMNYFMNERRPYPDAEPVIRIARETSSSRRSLDDGCCLRSPSEPLLESDADLSSSGFNLTYSYAPDLNQPDVKKTAVLRGSTWTEGKYNLQTQEVIGPTDKVVVTAYDIYNVEPAGRYYTFSYRTAKNNYQHGRIIFNFRQDEALPPPINQVQFVTDGVVYVYMGWMFSVTTDAGKTWRLWDAEKDLPGWNCCDPGLIREVSISSQGIGTMTLRPNSKQPEKLLHLHTNDFGQHWVNQ